MNAKELNNRQKKILISDWFQMEMCTNYQTCISCNDWKILEMFQ